MEINLQFEQIIMHVMTHGLAQKNLLKLIEVLEQILKLFASAKPRIYQSRGIVKIGEHQILAKANCL